MTKHMRSLLCLFLALTLYSCAPVVLPDIVWPLPPDPPRIKFVKSFTGTKGFYGFSTKDILLGVDSQTDYMSKPQGVHVDALGRVYVGDTAFGTVKVFDPAKKAPYFLRSRGRSVMKKPIGIASDAKGRIYVADSQANKVWVYNSNGSFKAMFGQKGEFRQPAGLAVDDERGRLYMVDTHHHKIFVLDLETGEILNTIGKRGEEEGELNFPSYVAINKKSGNIYVVDTMNGRVQVFDPKGRFLRGWGKHGDGFGQFARPKGIAVDSEGHVYVVDAAFNNIQIFDEEGQILMAFGEYGNGRGQQILPAGLAIDSEDRIYVVDSWNGRVNIYEFMGKKAEERKKREEAAAAKKKKK
ncbi:MAG: 6-bladed beta-propeller [Thermodesulfobacteriota bacterium]